MYPTRILPHGKNGTSGRLQIPKPILDAFNTTPGTILYIDWYKIFEEHLLYNRKQQKEELEEHQRQQELERLKVTSTIRPVHQPTDTPKSDETTSTTDVQDHPTTEEQATEKPKLENQEETKWKPKKIFRLRQP